MDKWIDNSELSDSELLERIRLDSSLVEIVYRRCKSNSMRFMRNRWSTTLDEDLEDVFQDAFIVLVERINGGGFNLTDGASFQTYLNSVCRNQLLRRFRDSGSFIEFNDVQIDESENQDELVNSNQNESFLSTITDYLTELEGENEPLFQALERAFVELRNRGGHCHEMLVMFWYQNCSIRELTEHFGYTTEVNTRNQKSKCQNRLRSMAFDILNEI
ncbi:MAG: sigma-70 family RNA polymerase sigma factor [Aquirufa antheringensis]|nr:sigma-70 family RNA polymerase sigma factor [Aquirufa antheringensis]